MVLPPNGPRCSTLESRGSLTPQIRHPGGVFGLMADGAVRFIADDIDAGDPSLPDRQSGPTARRWPLAPVHGQEFVPDARPITEWCRDHCRDQRGRIEKLLLVCDAVGHAHDRGVVHRDIKPGNVLVDGDGRPRLVDFGIAPWVAPAAPTISAAGRITGTPASMSPEQREGSPADA